MTHTDEPVKKILILAANPKDTSSLRLDEEVRDISEGLRRAAKRDQFDLEQRWATRPRDLRRALLEVSPQIVHFSGHGSHHEGLILEDEIGQSKSVSASALSGLFKLFSDKIECVLLNACYSASQAEAISQHIPYVIGTSQAINDKAAIEFAVGFYDALAAGHSIESAYKFGCISIQLSEGDENLTPVLVKGSTPKEAASKVTYEFVLSGSVDDVSRERLEAIVAHLRNITGDTSLTLLKVEEGSILLELEGSEEGFRVLEALQKDGKLAEVYGLRVKRVSHLSSSSSKNGDPIEVFFSYSHKDEDLRDELATHLSILERNGVISEWHDRKIGAGEEWNNQIDERINAASVVLLLVSSDFIASNYCWNVEVKRAMERHKAGEACVIPVLLRPVNWQTAPFGKLQALPKNAKPVTTWGNRDEAFLNISEGIEAVVNGFR